MKLWINMRPDPDHWVHIRLLAGGLFAPTKQLPRGLPSLKEGSEPRANPQPVPMVHFQSLNVDRSSDSKGCRHVRILIAKAPPMLRSILKAALGELPEAEIDEWDDYAQAAETGDEIEAIAEKIRESNADLAVFGSSSSCPVSKIKALLRRVQNIKVLVLDEQGRAGRLYYLCLRRICLRELSIGGIREALTEVDCGDGL
jgi:hypothetical protein